MVERPEDPHVDDQVVVVIAQGESVQAMRRDVLGSLQGRPRDLVIDLRRVEQLSNPGLALLVGVRARQRARQRTLTLVCASDSATEQMLSATGLRGRFTTVTTLASNGPRSPQPADSGPKTTSSRTDRT